MIYQVATTITEEVNAIDRKVLVLKSANSNPPPAPPSRTNICVSACVQSWRLVKD